MIGLEDPRRKAWIRLWSIVLAGACAAMVAVVLVSLWVLDDFQGLGIEGSSLIALLLGTVGATVLGVALMSLVFYSDTSRADDAVRDASTSEDEG